MSLIIRQTPSRKAAGSHALPAATRHVPLKELCGPETLISRIRETAVANDNSLRVRFWDDGVDRNCFCEPGPNSAFIMESQETQTPITVTIEKLRGKWRVTKCERA